MEFKHKPVLLQEVLDMLDIKPNGVYVDCTLGGGGHSEEILKRLTGSQGRLIGVDRDEEAIAAAKTRLQAYGNKIEYLHNNYKNIADKLPDGVDGILIDNGISSYQIDNAERGFSYMKDAPLDMRMDQNESISARFVVNSYSKEELTKIFREYGEERYASLIADQIVKQRTITPIETTFDLVRIIESIPPLRNKWNRKESGHPAKRCFQAIRIEVNSELVELYETVLALTKKLRKGGRIAIISFHSLEDRIVKQAFRYMETDCLCDKHALICTCGKKQEVEILTKKPITASIEEQQENPRACSAKLRVAKRIIQ